MLETLDCQLNKSDLIYLTNLLYTIKISNELAAKIIPLKGSPAEESNFYKVTYKIENLLRQFGENKQPEAIPTPNKSYVKSKKKPSKTGLKGQDL
jgi:hypothetical protein